ncbi:MAG: response regulator [Syntrophaceae bacterium]|nr:response regulator [Syntrophaceae bacterium]
MASRILVADDEKDIVELIAFNLAKEGFDVIKAYDGEAALELARSGNPDLLLLDLMLPGIPGLDLCRMLRRDLRTTSLPIIMVTARGDEVDRVLGLEMGADDYVTKPFSVRELVARVRAVLRRRMEQKTPPEEIIDGGPIRINLSTCEVSVGDRRVELSAKELRLLAFLARRPGRVYTRDQILEQVWGDEVYVEPRTVDVHIKRLRARVEENPEKPRLIQTVRGIGYRLADGTPE